ncbi:unnamed protein product [Clavelina lepadiformis]|uniref:PiggyBac transposable element-derived protein domain-containing protein n=1 Tax=Clavelina lepadiformis TaxID=159417 RepID=A0ABP0GG29_CLALP
MTESAAEDELTESSDGESDSEDSAGNNDLTARSSFKERNGRVWDTTCPQPSRTRACNLRHTTKGSVDAAKKTSKMRGIVGLLSLIGVNRSQHESLRSLWSSGPLGKAIFPASFGRNRLQIQ